MSAAISRPRSTFRPCWSGSPAMSKELLAADTSAVFLAEPDGTTLRAIVALGDNAAEFRSYVVPLGVGIIGDLARRGVAEVINDTGSDPRAVLIPHAAPAVRAPDVAPLIAPAGDRPDDHLARVPAQRLHVGRPQFPGRPGARPPSQSRTRAVRGDAAGPPRRRAANVAKSTFLANTRRAAHAAERVLGFAQAWSATRSCPAGRRWTGHHRTQRRAFAGPDQRCAGDVQDRGRAGDVNETTFDLRRLLQSVEEMFQLRARPSGSSCCSIWPRMCRASCAATRASCARC